MKYCNFHTKKSILSFIVENTPKIMYLVSRKVRKVRKVFYFNSLNFASPA
jgi:hypothetical protein